MHKCPSCGKPTEGSFSEGGVHFAICEECYDKEYKERKRNEVIHQQLGVDGWQEIYADAPSEEDIRQEMAGDQELRGGGQNE